MFLPAGLLFNNLFFHLRLRQRTGPDLWTQLMRQKSTITANNAAGVDFARFRKKKVNWHGENNIAVTVMDCPRDCRVEAVKNYIQRKEILPSKTSVKT